MLQKLRLQNFQKHKNLEVDFSPAINTIVAPTDSGKSSIVRALAWVGLNSSIDRNFTRTGAKKCSVLLTTEDSEVERELAGKSNSYTVNEQELKAFRTTLPDEVFEALQLSRLNFQLQHDPPFWFSLSPGETSKQLNKLVDLSIMDSALAYVGKKERDSKNACKYLTGRLAVKRGEVKELRWVKKALADFKRIENLNAKLEEVSKQSNTLNTLISSLSNTTRAVEYLNQAKKEFRSVQKTKEEYDSVACEFEALEKCVNKLKRLDSAIDAQRKARQKLETKMHKMLKGKCPICGAKFNG